MSLTKEEFDIIGHTLGINVYHALGSELKKDTILPDEFYRNYYCSSIDNPSPICLGLESRGLMHSWKQFDNMYHGVNEKGITVFRNHFKIEVTDTFKPPRKGKSKYLEYYYSEYPESFPEFLGIKLPRIEHKYSYTARNQVGEYRYVSTKYNDVSGEWKATKAEAKKSYKSNLRNHLKSLK